MASGGFAYEQSSVTYVSANYSTKKDWALAVHCARCVAFARATDRDAELNEGETHSLSWKSITFTGSSYPVLHYTPEFGITFHVQDLHPESVDPNGDYPALITIFEDQKSYAQYAIITALGYTNNSSHSSTPSQGLYIPSMKIAGRGNYYHLPVCLAHMFGANGISSAIDITSGSLGSGELTISEICGLAHYDTSGTDSSASYNSILKNPSQNMTYTFGYAKKGLAIECFYKAANYGQNVGMMFSVIGNIFDGDTGYDPDEYTFSKFPFGYVAPWNNSLYETQAATPDRYCYVSNDERIDCDCLCEDGISYRWKDNNANVASAPLILPSNVPLRSNSNTPEKLPWSSASLGFTYYVGYNTTRTFVGIDGLGNNFKGFLRNDIWRYVSICATRVGGSTYQEGNFVAMNCGAPQNFFELGILIGWDASNQSIL